MTEAAPVTNFHFLYPMWLWGLFLPLMALIWPSRYHFLQPKAALKDYADPHLLPFLSSPCYHYHHYRQQFVRWGILWTLGILAMAGPRWDYQTITLQQAQQEAFILLDISRSMLVNDHNIERILLARQEINDLLTRAQGEMRIGLIAFASVAQLIEPMTDDIAAIRQTLDFLSPTLVNQQGSRLLNALNRVQPLLAGYQNPALIIVSDGDFADDEQLEAQVQQLKNRGIHLHVLGIGTPEGGVVPGLNNGQMSYYGLGRLISRLDEVRLQRLATLGGGIYQRAGYTETDTEAIIQKILADKPALNPQTHTLQIWQERFPWLIGLMMLLALPWFRRERGI